MSDQSAYLSPPELARRWGTNPSRVVSLIHRGELAAIDLSAEPGVGRPRWKVSPDAIAQFESRRSNHNTQTATQPQRRKRSKYKTFV